MKSSAKKLTTLLLVAGVTFRIISVVPSEPTTTTLSAATRAGAAFDVERF